MPTTNADRKRKYNASEKGKRARIAYQNTETHKARQKLYDAKQLSTESGKLKRKARYTINNAVRWGRMVKLPCQICGDVKSQAHHNDYSKPLEVWWLCRKHHTELHRRII